MRQSRVQFSLSISIQRLIILSYDNTDNTDYNTDNTEIEKVE